MAIAPEVEFFLPHRVSGKVISLFGDRRRGTSTDDDVLAQLDRIRKHVVEPIVEKIELQLEGLRGEVRQQGDRIERGQQQTERAQEQTSALIRNLTDPETGAITRNEWRMIREQDRQETREYRDAADRLHENLDDRLGKMERAENGSVTADHERRIRARETPTSLGTIIGWIAGAIASLVGLAALLGHVQFK